LGKDIFKVLQLRIIHPRPTSQLWAIFPTFSLKRGRKPAMGQKCLPACRQAGENLIKRTPLPHSGQFLWKSDALRDHKNFD
jgi:hypothetical protein